MRTATATTLAAIALVAGSCAAPAGEPAAGTGTARASAASSSGTATATSSTTGTVAATSLDGTWTTGKMTVGDVTAHLRAAELGQWAAGFMRVDHHQSEAESVAYTIKLAGGRLSLFAEVAGNAPTRYDHGLFRVEGDRFIGFAEDESCQGVFRWALTGDKLRLSMLSDTCPDVDGLPDEVFGKAYYETRPWTRVAS